jgi:hypothetical protein
MAEDAAEFGGVERLPFNVSVPLHLSTLARNLFGP